MVINIKTSVILIEISANSLSTGSVDFFQLNDDPGVGFSPFKQPGFPAPLSLKYG
jgi:hypothetical protein